MINKIICPVCGAGNTIQKAEIGGYQEGKTYGIQECMDCESSFSIPHKSDENIYQLIYKNAEKVPGYHRYFNYAENVLLTTKPLAYLAASEAMYWAVKRTLAGYALNKNSSILEVGSGLGYLTYALSKEGYAITGVDISENAVQSATKKFGPLFLCKNIFELGAEYKNRFDFIILTEVLEHVENPVAFVECLVEMLKPDGKILLTTPNKSVSKSMGFWDSELPPVHLSWFAERSLTTIATQAQCTVSFVDFAEFNRSYFDVMRFKFYNPMQRDFIFNRNGNLKDVAKHESDNIVEKIIKSFLLFLCRFSLFDKILTRAEYPKSKSSTMGVIMARKGN